MSSVERREQEREELRRLILETTLGLLASEDYEKVSMRLIAEKINYSPTAIYLHFKDKGELMDALATEGFARLADALEAAHAAEPTERLQRIGDAYVAFALANPAVYRLMFQFGDNPQKFYEGHNVHRIASARALTLLVDAVREVKGAPRPETASAAEHDAATFAAVVFWAHVHGAIALMQAGRNRRFAGAETQFYRKAIDTAVAGLIAKQTD